MAHCSITVLGGMQVNLDGHPLEGMESTKVRALLAYLALNSEQPLEREYLVSLLWPEVSDAQARQRLSQALYNLRMAFGEAGKTEPLANTTGPDAPFILVTPHTIQFNPLSDYRLDVKEFESRLRKIRQHAHHRPENCSQCARLILEAEHLFQGDFLTGLSVRGCQAFEEWVLVVREKLHRQMCEALSVLATYYEGRDELALSSEMAERWSNLDPFSEPAQRMLMRLLALDGKRTQALARYAGFRRQLLAELGVEPGSETRQLYERILAEETAQTNLPGMPGRLPVPLTPFIGRGAQLAELSTWLHDPNMRLVTILGPGGSGKTRLALQAARSLRYDYPDGLFLVSLSGLSSSEAFLPALATALGMVFQANWGEPFEQLLGYLSRRHLLLILDSFEEVPAAAELVPRILQAAPHIQILVTSRTRMNLQSEQIFPLEGMLYPDPESLNGTLPDLDKFSALQMFLSAAHQVRPGYKLNSEDMPHLVRICQLVDGMPLGLLLAAGWLETCSLQEIAVEIERSLDFLSASWRDVPERQRSLRATLDYSWHLLDDDERQIFQKLSVFQRNITRSAAEQVTQVSAAGLRRLVDKSMLYTGQSLYRMHDMLRQYAAEKLSADTETAQRTKDLHCTYFLERLAEREQLLKSAQRSAILPEVDIEINDIQAAWRWACTQARLPLIAQSLECLGLYYEMRVRYSEGRQACLAGLSIRNTDPLLEIDAQMLRARLLLWLASFQVALGEIESAQASCSETSSLLDQFEAQGLNARHIRARYWHLLGDAQKDLRTQLEFYQRGIALYQEIGDTWRIANMLRWAGELAQRLGEASLSIQYLQEALHLARQVGEPSLVLRTMQTLATVYYILNQYDAGRQLMQEASVFADSFDDLPARATAQMYLGVQLAWSGHPSEGIELLEQSLPSLRSLGYRFGYVFGTLGLGLIYTMTGKYARAEAILQDILIEAEQGGFSREAASSLLGLGMAELALGRPAQAVLHIQDSVQRYHQMHFTAELGWALGGLALALEADGQLEAATNALVEALHIAEQTHNMFTMWTCLSAMIVLLADRGHIEAALLVYRILLAHPAHRNLQWETDRIGSTLPQYWESLPDERHLQIEASASRHTPFTIIPEVVKRLES